MSVQRAPRPRVLYILSTGRSGSTLLEMLLNAQPGLITTGEVQLLPFEMSGGNQRCSCGAPTPQCPFWSKVWARLPEGTSGEIVRFRHAHNRGQTLRPGHVLGALFGRRDRSAADVVAYGAANAALFGAVLAEAGHMPGPASPWIVDSSKDPYRMLWLARSSAIDVAVVHLVREPRGYVNSVLKGHNERGRIARLALTAQAAGRWVQANLIYALLARRAVPRQARAILWYETLATAPEETLKRFVADLGIEAAATAPAPANGIVHAISGSRLRATASAVNLDTDWKSGLDRAQQLAVTLIAGLPSAMLRRAGSVSGGGEAP